MANRPGPGSRKAGRADGGYSRRELKLGRVLRAAYKKHRSDFESSRRGVAVVWHVARVYDKGRAATVEQRGVEPLWPRLARWCLEQRLDPVAYLSFQFAKVLLGRPPEPNQLMTAAHLEHYKRHRKKARGEIKHRLRRELWCFKEAVQYETLVRKAEQLDAWATALTDDDLSVSPLLRYCLAKSVGNVRFERIANYFQSSAVVQLRADPRAYVKYWAELLPAGFAKKSFRLFMHLVGD